MFSRLNVCKCCVARFLHTYPEGCDLWIDKRKNLGSRDASHTLFSITPPEDVTQSRPVCCTVRPAGDCWRDHEAKPPTLRLAGRAKRIQLRCWVDQVRFHCWESSPSEVRLVYQLILEHQVDASGRKNLLAGLLRHPVVE